MRISPPSRRAEPGIRITRSIRDLIVQTRPPPFPEHHASPADEAPRPPRRLGTAIVLGLLFGPLGLFYVSTTAALFMLFVTIVAGIGTMGLALFVIWPACAVLAAALAMASAEPPSPPGDGDRG